MTGGSDDWAFFDKALDGGIQLGLEVDSVVYRESTDLQELVIYDTAQWGRVMSLDGVMQVCQRDEFIYHEMMTHVPLFAHGAARHVCVIGGGDGGIAREALRHPVEKVTMVEIDPSVVELSKKWLPFIADGAFEDPRLDLVIDDGAKFMADGDAEFDVIVVDSTDPMGPGEVLFTSEFYADCRSRLKPGGVMTTQSGVPMFQGQELTDTVARLGENFSDPAAYVAAIPTYIGGFMAMGWASDDPALRSIPVETLQERFTRIAPVTKYYNPAIHKGAFALPSYVADHAAGR